MFLLIETLLSVETKGGAEGVRRSLIMYRLDEIAAVLAATKDSSLVEDFLRAILTESEIEEISSRWEIVKLLKEGVSQRKISDRLGVSLCKITRGSKELRENDSAMEKMVDKFYKYVRTAE